MDHIRVLICQVDDQDHMHIVMTFSVSLEIPPPVSRDNSTSCPSSIPCSRPALALTLGYESIPKSRSYYRLIESPGDYS